VAVKIVRQHNRIALLGAPMSAAALAPGGEGAPSALRNARLISKLQSAGYEVTDMGDDPAQLYKQDDEGPRARNLARVLAGLEALRPRVELAVKSGALPIILGGDCSIGLATVAGLRRYYRNVSMLYADADADLQTPATTTSGCVDGMVVSHLVGRGASEMVRFWTEPPLVREPDLALFGVSRLDPAEEQVLQTSPLRRYLAEDIRRKSPTKAAIEAIERIHGNAHEFVLHFDVDVIGGFQATNLPASDGLRAEEVREAFDVFVEQAHLAAIQVTGYNPERDADGAGARFLVEFIGELLATRRPKMKDAPAPARKSAAAQAENAAEEEKIELPAVAVGEAWSPDMIEEAGTADASRPAEEVDAANIDESEEPRA
jgi:arginase